MKKEMYGIDEALKMKETKDMKATLTTNES